MDPRLIDGVRRGQAEARDDALARVLVARRLVDANEIDGLLEASRGQGLGTALVASGRLTTTLLAELEHAVRLDQVLEAMAGPPAPGQAPSRRIGRYEVKEELGRGAMGEVYRAHDPTLGRDVALKLLLRDSTYALERFVREARILARLQHPGIPPVHEVEQHEGRAYLAMQYVPGTTLEGLDVPRRRAAEIVRDAARAVQYAHEQGVVHRDLKPANLVVDGAGQVFVLDFGMAKAIDTLPALTATGELLGTPAYMAPEQAMGFPADERSDVYGLGATLYRLLSGDAPYRGGEPLDVLRRVAATPPEPLPAVDALTGIVERAMARERKDRFPTAGALADAIDDFLLGREPATQRPRSWWRRLFGRGAPSA
ncbi:MAG: serine/threonine-protein kinase [Planctomycetota bacterium]